MVWRDGRDVVCSHLEVGERFRKHGASPDRALADLAEASVLWSATVQRGNEMCGPSSDLFQTNRVCLIRFRDIVNYPERECRRLCDFLDLPFESQMLEPQRFHHDTVIDGTWVPAEVVDKPIDRSRVGRWRKDMQSFKDRVIFAAVAQKYLNLFEFESDSSWGFLDVKCPPDVLRKQLDEAKQEVHKVAARYGLCVDGTIEQL